MTGAVQGPGPVVERGVTRGRPVHHHELGALPLQGGEAGAGVPGELLPEDRDAHVDLSIGGRDRGSIAPALVNQG